MIFTQALDIGKELTDCKNRILENYYSKRIKASGNTERLLEVKCLNEMHYQLLGPDYLYTFEKGREPGEVPHDFANIIFEWSKAKGITLSDDKERMRFARNVARKIEAEGTELYRMGGRNDVYSEALDDAIYRIEQRLNHEILEKVSITIDEALK